MTILNDPGLNRILASLHAKSDDQVAAMNGFHSKHANDRHQPTPDEIKAFRSDKLVALDRDKARFCYQLCRATDARRIVEVGTSYGVSTLYLAAAVHDNIETGGGDGVVIATEYEPGKAAAARMNFEAAGLSRLIDLREGDWRDTLRQIDGQVDFVLIDIWIAMARPALELVAPSLRPGAIVVCDNTGQHRNDYADYFAYLNDPSNGFQTMTLPFSGGFEFSVRCGT
jgi:predicted O-methyltransferase YrrM